eukprot:gene4428-23865_t
MRPVAAAQSAIAGALAEGGGDAVGALSAWTSTVAAALSDDCGSDPCAFDNSPLSIRRGWVLLRGHGGGTAGTNEWCAAPHLRANGTDNDTGVVEVEQSELGAVAVFVSSEVLQVDSQRDEAPATRQSGQRVPYPLIAVCATVMLFWLARAWCWDKDRKVSEKVIKHDAVIRARARRLSPWCLDERTNTAATGDTSRAPRAGDVWAVGYVRDVVDGRPVLLGSLALAARGLEGDGDARADGGTVSQLLKWSRHGARPRR